MKKVYRAANAIVVATIDGGEQVYEFSRDLLVHGGKDAGVDVLAGLREGSSVVVRYTPDVVEPPATEIDRIGDEGVKVTEGMVTHIDRRRTAITFRFDNGTIETLRLVSRASAEAEADSDRSVTDSTRVIIYYKDETGRRVPLFFRRAS
jgi:hypothetical protein